MNKFRNKITETDGIKFRSKKEAKRYWELKLLLNAGEIVWFKCQVPYVVAGDKKIKTAIKYIADFEICWKTENGFKRTVEDVKGIRTPLYKLKKQLMLDKYGIAIVEI